MLRATWCLLALVVVTAGLGLAHAEVAPRASRSQAPLSAAYPAFGVAFHHLAHVYDRPARGARPVGYLRRGAQFRAGEEAGRDGCKQGWFEIPGPGYVCRGRGFWIDSKPRGYAEAPAGPWLSDGLPYPYGKVVRADVPQYFEPPDDRLERAVEAELSRRRELAAAAEAQVDPNSEPQPDTTSDLTNEEASQAASDADEAPPLPPAVRRTLQPGFYVSLDRQTTASPDGGDTPEFARTVRGGYVRQDRLLPVDSELGLGVGLGRRLELPLAFVYRGGAHLLRRDPLSGRLERAGKPKNHSVHPLTPERVLRGGRTYVVARSGHLLRDTAVRVARKRARPTGVGPDARWVHVDLRQQTLVAYEGDTPVFATLVSSGKPGHDTPRGLFRIYAKHVTTTMADDLAADGPYSIEDVPWTMYFHGSFALHAAFWHKRFGQVRSHGCVNLAPRDARWLFFWSAPELPSAWHGVLANVGHGTFVFVEGDEPAPAVTLAP